MLISNGQSTKEFRSRLYLAYSAFVGCHDQGRRRASLRAVSRRLRTMEKGVEKVTGELTQNRRARSAFTQDVSNPLVISAQPAPGECCHKYGWVFVRPRNITDVTQLKWMPSDRPILNAYLKCVKHALVYIRSFNRFFYGRIFSATSNSSFLKKSEQKAPFAHHILIIQTSHITFFQNVAGDKEKSSRN